MSVEAGVRKRLTDAIATLSRELTASTPTPASSHETLLICGLSDESVKEALATYLVGLQLTAVDQAGRICTDLIGEAPGDAQQIVRDIEYLVVPSQDVSDIPHWKSTFRNAWIAEGIWHCCMRVAMVKHELHPHGEVIAIDYAHISPKDHGLDVTVMYKMADGSSVGLSFIETKAYSYSPNKAIADAVSMHAAIERGVHDARLRQVLSNMRSYLDVSEKPLVKASLWKNECMHIPNPHYESEGATVNWDRERRVFSGLKHPVTVMPHAISGFDAFFDEMGDMMLLRAHEFAANV